MIVGIISLIFSIMVFLGIVIFIVLNYISCYHEEITKEITKKGNK